MCHAVFSTSPHSALDHPCGCTLRKVRGEGPYVESAQIFWRWSQRRALDWGMAEIPKGDSGEWVRLTARVDGVVQAVGFRYWTVRKAEELGLTGTVRNNSDGTVGIAAEGPQSVVLEFRRWLRSPDAPGRVDDVDESISRATGAFSNFRVVY